VPRRNGNGDQVAHRPLATTGSDGANTKARQTSFGTDTSARGLTCLRSKISCDTILNRMIVVVRRWGNQRSHQAPHSQSESRSSSLTLARSTDAFAGLAPWAT